MTKSFTYTNSRGINAGSSSPSSLSSSTSWVDHPLDSLGDLFGGNSGLGGFSQWMQIGTAVSGVIDSYFSSRISGIQMEAQASSLRYQADLASINSDKAYKKSLAIRKAGEEKAAIYGLQAAQQIANTRANQGASGVKIGYGSSGDVINSMKFSAQHDIWSMSMDTLSAAHDAENQAQSYSNQSSLLSTQASMATSGKRSTFSNLANALMSGVGSLMSNNANVLGRSQLNSSNGNGRS